MIESFIFDEIDLLGPKMDFYHLSQVSQSASVPIIIYHDGLLMVQRGSLGEIPIPSLLGWGGGNLTPYLYCVWPRRIPTKG